jgi:hypothetical protein
MTDPQRRTHGTRRMRIDEIQVVPTLKAPDDPVFRSLYVRAVRGELPVYLGAVPPALVDAFDPSFHPEIHPAGRQAVDALCDGWRRTGKFRVCWVYPRNGRYVLADDYVTLAAVRRAKPEYMPCLLLGDPVLDGVVDAQGPLALELVRKHAGLA